MARARSTLFDRWSEVYDRRGFQAATYRPVHDAVLARLTGAQPRLVVDLGCGTGQLTLRLSERFPDADHRRRRLLIRDARRSEPPSRTRRTTRARRRDRAPLPGRVRRHRGLHRVVPLVPRPAANARVARGDPPAGRAAADRLDRGRHRTGRVCGGGRLDGRRAAGSGADSPASPRSAHRCRLRGGASTTGPAGRTRSPGPC